MNYIQALLFISLAYLLGCFCGGYYLVRFFTGKDIREFGSGNPGARNVGRLLGFKGFLISFLFDFLKAAFVMWFANFIGASSITLSLVMIAVIIGHIFPIQLNFDGGKGIASSLGALSVYNIYSICMLVLLIIPIYLLVKKTTLSGLLSFAFLPVFFAVLRFNVLETVTVTLVVLIILLTHRENIYDFFNG